MPDDKSKIGKSDRSRVAGEQDYEVSDIAEKYGISTAEARKLIERISSPGPRWRQTFPAQCLDVSIPSTANLPCTPQRAPAD
jgi:hypothetical protein